VSCVDLVNGASGGLISRFQLPGSSREGDQEYVQSWLWWATEPLVDQWALRRPDAAIAFRWERRRRLPGLARDLEQLAMAPSPPSMLAPPPSGFGPLPEDHDVLGWLYVCEGSALGGAVIAQHLKRVGITMTLSAFVPYPEGPRPMWRSYLVAADDWVAAQNDRVQAVDLVAAAAERAFRNLRGLVSPLAPDRTRPSLNA